MNTNYISNTKVGTAGGTLLALLLKINYTDLFNTALVAGVGAAVSFFVSIGMKWMMKKLGS